MKSLLVAAFAVALHSALAAQTFDVQRISGHPSVNANALTSQGARITYDDWRVTITHKGDTYRLALHSPFYTKNDKRYQLAAPVIRTGNTLWLPLQFVRTLQVAEAKVPDLNSQIPDPKPVAQQPSSPAAQAKQKRLVILDAGHGGRDPGKPGPTGLNEKTATLAIVKHLASFLRNRGYEVQLTRSTDTLIALADRPHAANTWKAQLPAAVFVSVHANSGATAARGFETYFLSEARTDDERRVAEMENAAVKFEETSAQPAPELDLIVSGLKNDFYQRASNDLAELVQQQLATVHPGPNRGVKQAGFRVLVGALMPAVLIETGFISNPEEARLLGTTAFQQKLAFGIAAAIDKFFETHEHFFAVPH